MGEAAEEAYVNAATSVWWDIENCRVPKICDVNSIARNISTALSNLNYCGNVSISAYGDTHQIPAHVQQALSSTGISINHVPAGAKDASDKKILVDMLFWAIDHKAPANYLLISGDRDFSHALHKLQMRKYNILLAHPRDVSPALAAAAKSAWLWTTLVTGGAPIKKNVPAQAVFGNSQFSSREQTRSYNSEPAYTLQSAVSQANISAAANTNFNPFVKVGTGNPEFKLKYIPKCSSQPDMTKAPIGKATVEDNPQLESEGTRVFMKAPHEFFRPKGCVSSTNQSAPSNLPANSDPSATNVSEPTRKQEDQIPSPTRPKFTPMHFHTVPGKMVKANPAYHSIPAFKPQSPPLPPLSLTSSLDLANLTLSHYPNDVQRSLNFSQQTGEVSKVNSVEKTNPESTSSLGTNPDNQTHAGASSSSGAAKAGGHVSNRSDYVLGNLGLVLDALERLKNDYISPTEANIADCIHFGDLKNINTNVTEALNSAVETKLVVRHTLGSGLPMYVRSGQKIWSCINPEGGDPLQYSKATWDKIEQFLISPSGQAAIVESSCKYIAASNLKKLCLQGLPLGHVIRIINILIGHMRWIQPNQSGWQPVTITITKAPAEASKDASA